MKHIAKLFHTAILLMALVLCSSAAFSSGGRCQKKYVSPTSENVRAGYEVEIGPQDALHQIL